MKAVMVVLVMGTVVPLAAQTNGAPQSAAAPAPVVSATPASIPVGSRVGETVLSTYEDGGRRDPFSSLIVPKRTMSANPGADGSRARTGLSSISLADVTVRGIVKAGPTMLALIEAPNKQSYTIRAKDRLFDATVVAVAADGVVFAEQGDPGMASSQVKKSLRPVGEGIR
jgi:hypothetical protein